MRIDAGSSIEAQPDDSYTTTGALHVDSLTLAQHTND